MSGINKSIVHSVTHLRAEFSDKIGNRKTILGTGFWIQHDPSTSILVTNRHVLDAALLLGQPTSLRLTSVQIELRRADEGTLYADTKFFEVLNLELSLRLSQHADCAVLHKPELGSNLGEFKILFRILQTDIADNTFLAERVQVMDFASFIGFPGDSQNPWWDTRFNFPIARLCSIASLPELPFSNPAVKTSDATLVTGFSFSGSSGSPVILHQKGIRAGGGLEDPSFVPPKVIGIMSGHKAEQSPTTPMLQHTGISYFTRSTSILQIINSV